MCILSFNTSAPRLLLPSVYRGLHQPPVLWVERKMAYSFFSLLLNKYSMFFLVCQSVFQDFLQELFYAACGDQICLAKQGGANNAAACDRRLYR